MTLLGSKADNPNGGGGMAPAAASTAPSPVSSIPEDDADDLPF